MWDKGEMQPSCTTCSSWSRASRRLSSSNNLDICSHSHAHTCAARTHARRRKRRRTLVSEHCLTGKERTISSARPVPQAEVRIPGARKHAHAHASTHVSHTHVHVHKLPRAQPSLHTRAKMNKIQRYARYRRGQELYPLVEHVGALHVFHRTRRACHR